MKRITISWKWMLLPLFVLAAALVLCMLSSFLRTGKEALYLTPTFQDIRGWEIYTLSDGSRTSLTPQELMGTESFETFYLSRKLTEELETDGYTFLFLDSCRPCSVFLDGKLLYTTCPDSGQSIGLIHFPTEYKGLPQRAERIRCTLPSDFAGKTLTIATAHTEYPSMPGVILSAEAIETTYWMSMDNHSAMPAAAFATAALLLLGLLFYSLFQGRRDFSLLLLTVAAFVQLLYYLRQYEYTSPASTALDNPLYYFLLPLLVILPELFLTVLMKRRRKLCAALVLPPAALSLIPPIAYLFGPLSFSSSPFFEALYISLAALLVCAALEALDNNRVFRLFLSGLGVICSCIIALVLPAALSGRFYSGYPASVFALAWDHAPELLLYWCGTILFVLSAAISVSLLIRNTADTQTKIALQTERLNQLDHELAVQKQFYEEKLGREEELRALRHDMRGHLSTLAALLADGRAEEASVYLDSLQALHQERQNEVFCGNPYMNAVLGAYSNRFRENGVAFTCRVGIDSQVLPGMEICLIMSNALENALEASLLLPDEERSVKVQAMVRQNQLLLRVSNRFNGILDEHGVLPSTTKTEKGHGYGLTNISSTSERLGGEMLYRVEGGFFVLDVRFPLPQNAEKGDIGYAV